MGFNEQKYHDYLKDKNVILVGPAGYLIGEKRGVKIDSYDVIVRINRSILIKEEMKVDLGSRTDILYLNRSFSKNKKYFNQVIDWQKKYGIQWIINKMSIEKKIRENIKRKIKKVPNTGVYAILHILSAPIKSLKIVGMDFYTSGYYDGYKNIDNILEIMENSSKHDIQSQLELIIKLWESDSRINIDDVLKERWENLVKNNNGNKG